MKSNDSYLNVIMRTDRYKTIQKENVDYLEKYRFHIENPKAGFQS